ncbi:MAG: alpha/beta fold hydrolase [Sandaracinus sp.]|nr:alpha/beta fold hydrolase [Sandaracinus sp.]MCB9621635.1 alpha/beta fold hydrolase [Sandaracinus sp.]MCB9622336.1 alpha/beta fold hydrolase [Sandaracinus sp.]MCB9636462.1 alpha/beta fold hydrolase [Sandaracinus sp.]
MTTPAAASTADRDLTRLGDDRVFSYVYDGPGRETEAPTFLLVHGLPGSARDFRWLAPVLAERGAHVVRLEMPGFGETPLSTEPDASVEARGRFVVRASEALGLERPWLVGHSMGGVVGAMAATLSPAAFAGLALVSSPGLRVHRGFRKARPKLAEAVLSLPFAERVLRVPMRRLFENTGFRGATDLGIRHTMRCIAVTDIAEHAKRLKALRLPILHAYCDHDPFIERDIFDETARTVGGPVLRFAEGGHNPQKFQSVELGHALTGWSRGELY